MTFLSRFGLPFSAVSLAVVAIATTANSAIAQDRNLWLTDNQSTLLQGYFLQGEDIYAICDEDCQDLDLFLYDINGTLVDADEALDAFPIVTAPYEGTFSIKIFMPSCNHRAGCAASISSEYGF